MSMDACRAARRHEAGAPHHRSLLPDQRKRYLDGRSGSLACTDAPPRDRVSDNGASARFPSWGIVDANNGVEPEPVVSFPEGWNELTPDALDARVREFWKEYDRLRRAADGAGADEREEDRGARNNGGGGASDDDDDDDDGREAEDGAYELDQAIDQFHRDD